MSTNSSDLQATALSTLALLETRLRRIEFLLTGTADLDGRPTFPTSDDETALARSNNSNSNSSKHTVTGRLQQLQDDLARLRKLPGPEGDLIRDVESLHTQTPEIFTDSTTLLSSAPSSTINRPPAQQTTHIFANTSLYTETASRLSSLQTLPVPPAEQSAHLVSLRPRIDAALARQRDLETQARDLRARSASCVEWWVKYGVVGMGEAWSEWEERVRVAERRLGRAERSKAARDGYV